jgi:response regulator RpfG family c-di-GMP phosphodiesterase
MVTDPIKILIVDDDEQVLIELEDPLESEGYKTTTAWCGREGLAFTDQMQFDILLVEKIWQTQTAPLSWRSCNAGNPMLSSCTCIPARVTKKRSPIHKWEHAEVEATTGNVLAA